VDKKEKNMRKRHLVTSLASCMLFIAVTASAHHPSGGTGLIQAGPITTVSASTMQKGKFTFGLQSEYIKLDAFSESRMKRFAEQGYDVHSVDSVNHHFLSISYGLTDNLTLAVKVPYEQINNIRETHADEPDETHKHGDSRGLGDITLLGHYRFLKRNSNLEAAATLGLKLPTGKTNDRDIGGETFEAEFLPGTGAWHPIIGQIGRAHV